jgi:hypothetical protein
MANSREEKKKFIGDLLKAADRYIKSAKYTEAMIEVNKALAVEPGNMYALAYNQRIKAALEALKKKEDENRVKKINEEKNAAAKAAEPPDAVPPESLPAADVQPAASASSEDDRYTIRQQQAQIERFKEEIESLRVKHQQEISVLAHEGQQARAAEQEAADKYRSLVDDAEESYRRVEELYAEVVRLNEQIAEVKRTAEGARAELATEREQLEDEHKREMLRLDRERTSFAENQERERQRFESESERRDAAHREEILQLGSEADKATEAHQQDILHLREDLRRAHDAQAQAEQKILEVAAETATLRSALSKQEAYLQEVTAEDDQRRRTLGESFLRAILDKLLRSDTIAAETKDLLNIVRTEIGLSDEEFAQLQTAVKHGIYRNALQNAWAEGYITPQQAEKLALLRRKIGISPESHFIIEDELRNAQKNR